MKCGIFILVFIEVYISLAYKYKYSYPIPVEQQSFLKNRRRTHFWEGCTVLQKYLVMFLKYLIYFNKGLQQTFIVNVKH